MQVNEKMPDSSVAVMATFFSVTDDETPVFGETKMSAGQVITGFFVSMMMENVQLGEDEIMPVMES